MLQDYIRKPNSIHPVNFGPPPIPMPPVSPPLTSPVESIIKEMSMFEYKDRYEFSPGDSDLWLQLFMMADHQLGQEAATILELIIGIQALC